MSAAEVWLCVAPFALLMSVYSWEIGMEMLVP